MHAIIIQDDQNPPLPAFRDNPEKLWPLRNRTKKSRPSVGTDGVGIGLYIDINRIKGLPSSFVIAAEDNMFLYHSFHSSSRLRYYQVD
jgi:hypothetical protein